MKYEYILKVEDGSLWLKVKECIKSRGEIENLDIRYLDLCRQLAEHLKTTLPKLMEKKNETN